MLRALLDQLDEWRAESRHVVRRVGYPSLATEALTLIFPRRFLPKLYYQQVIYQLLNYKINLLPAIDCAKTPVMVKVNVGPALELSIEFSAYQEFANLPWMTIRNPTGKISISAQDAYWLMEQISKRMTIVTFHEGNEA